MKNLHLIFLAFLLGVVGQEGSTTVQTGFGHWSYADSTHVWYARDFRGSVRNTVQINPSTGRKQMAAHMFFYPSGLPVKVAGAWRTDRIFQDKEWIDGDGVGWYDNAARIYDPIGMRFLTPDAKWTDDTANGPYTYCLGNPLTGWDPTGYRTNVIDLGNDRYAVHSVDIEDPDLGVYVVEEGENGLRDVKKLGETTSVTSFYNTDNSTAAVNSIIDLNDQSGILFWNHIRYETPNLIEYGLNATSGKLYDFKVTNFETVVRGPNEKLDIYRGMQIDTEGDVIIISSARDIGNMGAGYIAGFYGFSWPSARLIFDFVQGDFRHIEEEGPSTQKAERYGFEKGQDANYILNRLKKILKIGSHGSDN